MLAGSSQHARATPPGRSRRRATIIRIGCAYPAALLIIALAARIAPPRNGLPALLTIALPYLFLPLLAALPLLRWRESWPLRALLVACLLLWVTQFAPRLPRPAPRAAEGLQLDVLSWNISLHNTDPGSALGFLATRPADVIVLQEDYGGWYALGYDVDLTPAYPYVVKHGQGAPPGLVIMSTYPIIGYAEIDVRLNEHDLPRVAWARLDLGSGHTLLVATAHPDRAPLGNCLPGGSRCYQTAQRDGEVAAIRTALAPLLRTGEPLLLAGDFNLTEREAAYRDLTLGLQDAYRAVGTGTGQTWGPPGLNRRGLPLLRIDYLLTNAGVLPLRLAVDCTPRGSDHCALRGRVVVR